jgi:hypothetical protein
VHGGRSTPMRNLLFRRCRKSDTPSLRASILQICRPLSEAKKRGQKVVEHDLTPDHPSTI